MSFSAETCALLDSAERICLRRGARLTDLRREVLGHVLESTTPAGAYDLLGRLSGGARRAAPPTVYRALEFLLAQGLIHKIERLSAFVGCIHGASHDHPHSAQFLICRKCGQASEFESPLVKQALAQAAGSAGFIVHSAIVEAEGVCARCIRAGYDAQPADGHFGATQIV
jgi:Fur family zinc uptake transcriptional regulator